MTINDLNLTLSVVRRASVGKCVLSPFTLMKAQADDTRQCQQYLENCNFVYIRCIWCNVNIKLFMIHVCLTPPNTPPRIPWIYTDVHIWVFEHIIKIIQRNYFLNFTKSCHTSKNRIIEGLQKQLEKITDNK